MVLLPVYFTNTGAYSYDRRCKRDDACSLRDGTLSLCSWPDTPHYYIVFAAMEQKISYDVDDCTVVANPTQSFLWNPVRN